MNNTAAHTFYFTVEELSGDALRVVRFEGHSAIGECYEYTVLLMCYDTSLKTSDLHGKVAHLKIVSPSGNENMTHGTLSRISMKTLTQEALFFEVLLVPNLWYLQNTNYYQIFINKSLTDIIKSVLDYAYMHSKIDYEFRLKQSYKPLEYITQYNESHFSFMKRLMEKYGLFFYFVQDKNNERLIICDERTFLDDEKKFDVTYRHGNTPSNNEEIVYSVSEHLNTISQKVIFQDYAYEHPSSVKQETLEVKGDGVGEIMSFNDNFLNPEELKRFAKVRSEIEACNKEIYDAKSTIAMLYAGCIYHLHHCLYDGYNESYLITSITHIGDQSHFLASMIPQELHSTVVYNYTNEFTVIPSDAPFRLPQKTPRPKIYGMISAKIDAESEGKYAQIDKWGRYKVKMPFDLSDAGSGKASTWLRMAQGSAGERMGMHFPLHKGTEVLVGFIGGDPDRPYINAAIPNMLTPSPVNDTSASQSKVVSDKNTAVTWEDKDGSEYLKFDVPIHQTDTTMGWITLVGGAMVSGVDTHTPNYQLLVENDSYTKVKGTQKEDIEKRVETLEEYATIVKQQYEISAGFTKTHVTGNTENWIEGSDTSYIGASISYVGFAFGITGIAISLTPVASNFFGQAVNVGISDLSFCFLSNFKNVLKKEENILENKVNIISTEIDTLQSNTADLKKSVTALQMTTSQVEKSQKTISSNSALLHKFNDMMIIGKPSANPTMPTIDEEEDNEE